MRTRSLFVSVLVAGSVAFAARADVPDGKGGRTSPSALNQAKPREVSVAMACCREQENRTYTDRVTNPVERKTMGHLAWVDSTTGPAPLRLCKDRTRREAKYNSPAELKALGHVAAETTGVETTVKVAGLSCCSGQDVRSCRIHQTQR